MMWIKNREPAASIIDEWINEAIQQRYTLTYNDDNEMYEITQYDLTAGIKQVILTVDATHKAYYFMDMRIGL